MIPIVGEKYYVSMTIIKIDFELKQVNIIHKSPTTMLRHK